MSSNIKLTLKADSQQLKIRTDWLSTGDVVLETGVNRTMRYQWHHTVLTSRIQNWWSVISESVPILFRCDLTFIRS